MILKIHFKEKILGTLKWSPPLLNSFILCLNLKLFHGYFHDHNFNSTSGSKIDRKWINKLFYGYITSLCIWIKHPIIENKASCKNIFIILIAANCFFDRVQVSELSRYRTFTSYQEKTFQYSILSPPWRAISSACWVLDEARGSTVLLTPRKFLKRLKVMRRKNHLVIKIYTNSFIFSMITNHWSSIG